MCGTWVLKEPAAMLWSETEKQAGFQGQPRGRGRLPLAQPRSGCCGCRPGSPFRRARGAHPAGRAQPERSPRSLRAQPARLLPRALQGAPSARQKPSVAAAARAVQKRREPVQGGESLRLPGTSPFPRPPIPSRFLRPVLSHGPFSRPCVSGSWLRGFPSRCFRTERSVRFSR